MTKTIRLIVPDWQAGDQPTYRLGAQVLAAIAPYAPQQEEILVTVPTTPRQLPVENGVAGQSIVQATVQRTQQAIQVAAPDKIITFGGNCLVSQAPFDYLNRRYRGNLGVIWLDAHPDISDPAMYDHEHAMVLGNLLHAGDPTLAKLVQTPLRPEQVYFAGLQDPTLAERTELRRLRLRYQLQTTADLTVAPLLAWIKQNRFDHVAIHFDIDALDPDPANFYATYFNNPHLGPLPDNAAKGGLQRSAVWRTIAQLSQQIDLVGLTIAEYLPWGAQELNDLMTQTRIFND